MINWQLSKQGNRWPVSPDRTAGSSVHPSRSSIFWSYPLTNYQSQMIVGSSSFFPMIHMKYVVFMSLWPRTVKILISNWPRTRKFNHFFLIQAGKNFYYHGHALVTLYVQFLYSDWSKIDRWVHAENLCGIMTVVYFESWSWQSFVSTCDVFNCLFYWPWMYKMKYSCYQESSVIHGWFVYWVFGWEMRRLSKFGNPISDCIVFAFHLA